jgi:hypothetical protein
MVARAYPSQRQLRRRLEPLVAQAAATPGADRYRKRFTAQAHLWVLLLHVLWGGVSLRQTHARVAPVTRWWRRWGLAGSVSLSQLARSSTSRPAACAEALLAAAVAAARRAPHPDAQWRKLARVAALDSTFIRLSATCSPWCVHGGHAAGVRLQTLLTLAPQIPDPWRLTLADANDYAAWAALDVTAWRGWTLVCDLGYYGHQQFARLRASGVSFITRLQDQATWTVTAKRPTPVGPTPDGDVILADWTITLGSPANRRGAVLPGLRLVISQNAAGVTQRFLTDRHDLVATEVVQLYRQRWQIELFFRWLKRQLGLLRPLGRSPEAVWLSVLVVVCVALLLLALEAARPPAISRIAWLGQLATILTVPLADG